MTDFDEDAYAQAMDTSASTTVQQRARNNLYAAAGQNPQEAAQISDLARQTGLTSDQVALDPPTFASQLKQQKAEQAIESSPAVGSYLSVNPLNGAVMNADVDKLGQLAKLDDPMGDAVSGWFDDAGKSFLYAWRSNELNRRIGLDSKLGMYDPKKYEGEETALNELRSSNGLSPGAEMLGGFLGSLGSQGKTVVQGAAAGGLVGAAAGGVGAIPGAVTGATAGFMADMAITSMGSKYRELDQFRDNDGNHLSETVKQTASLATGIVAGVLGGVGGHLTGQLAVNLASRAVTRMVAEPVLNNALAKAAGQIGAAGLQFGAINTGIYLADHIIGDAAKHLSSGDVETLFNNWDKQVETLEGAGSAMWHGALLGGLIGIAPAGVGYFSDKAQAAQFQNYRNMLNNARTIIDSMDATKIAPESVADFVDNHMALAPIKVSADAVAEQQAAGKLGFIPKEDVAAAQASGADISIKGGDYFTKVEPEVHTALQPHIRDAQGVSEAEAKDLEGKTIEDYVPRTFSDSKSDVHTLLTNEIAAVQEKIGQEGLSDTAREAYASHIGDLEQQLRDATAARQQVAEKPAAGLALAAQESWRDKLWLGPIFENASATGMDQAAFVRYSKAIQAQQRSLTEGAMKAAEKEISRRETKLWKENLKHETEAAETQVSSRSDIVADEYLRAKASDVASFKLSRQAIDNLYSEGDAPRLGAKTGISENLPDSYFGPEGHDPQLVAESSGFRTAREMIDALVRLNQAREGSGMTVKAFRKSLVDDAASRAMDTKYGTLEDRILGEALEHAISVKQLEVMVQELNQMAPNSELTVEKLQALVKETHAKLSVKDGRDVDGFTRKVMRYGKEAHDALQKGEMADAFKARQRQAINMGLRAEAKEFNTKAEKTLKLAERYAGEKVVAGRSQRFTGQIQNLILQHDGGNPFSSPGALNEAIKGVSLVDFINERRGDGQDILTNPTTVGANPKKLENFTVNDLREFSDTLQSMDYHSRREEWLENDTKKAELRAVLDNLAADFTAFGDKAPSTDNAWTNKVTKFMRGLDASQLKLEQLFDWIDRDNIHGTLNTWVIRPLKEAQYFKQDLMADLAKRFEDSPILATRGMTRVAENDRLMDANGKLMKMTKENILTIALNMGNESNKRVLLNGRKWGEADVLQVLQKNMTSKDMAWVQHVWDTIGTLWPHLRDAGEKATGVAPERIESAKLKINGETIKGGYFPLIRDRMADKVDSTEGPFERANYNPMASARAFHDRTGATYPIDLSLSLLPNTLRETVHGIAFRTPVAEAWKVLNSNELKRGLIDHYGEEYYKQIKPWIRDIANDGGTVDNAATSALTNLVNAARANSIVVAVGFRLSTAVIHGGSAFSNSLGEVGPTAFADAAKDLWQRNDGAGAHWMQFVYDNSGEIRNRGHTMERDLNAQVDASFGESQAKRRFAAASGYMIRQLDQATAVPTWLAAYRTALKDGERHDDAVFAADKAVRNAHGANALMDQAALQRGGAWQKLFTMYYGYFNHNYNRIRDIGVKLDDAWQNKDATAAMAQAARATMYLLIPAMIHESQRGHHHEDDTWGKYFARGIAGQVAGTTIGLREIWPMIANEGFTSQGTPLVNTFNSVAAVTKDFHHWGDPDYDPKYTEHALKAFGGVTGRMTGTMAGWAQEGVDHALGSDRAQDDISWWKMIADGQHKVKKSE